MELPNDGRELVGGGRGGGAALWVQVRGVGCVPRARGTLRRKTKMVMMELKGGVAAGGSAERSEGMDQGVGKRKAVPPVLLKSSNWTSPELRLCVGDTVLKGQTRLRLPRPAFGCLCAHFQQQRGCPEGESKRALRCGASL